MKTNKMNARDKHDFEYVEELLGRLVPLLPMNVFRHTNTMHEKDVHYIWTNAGGVWNLLWSTSTNTWSLENHTRHLTVKGMTAYEASIGLISFMNTVGAT